MPSGQSIRRGFAAYQRVRGEVVSPELRQRVGKLARSATRNEAQEQPPRGTSAASKKRGGASSRVASSSLDKDLMSVSMPASSAVAPHEYALDGLPLDVHVAASVFEEVRERCPDFSPETMADYGCAVGGALWAAKGQFGDTLKEYTGIQDSKEYLRAARTLSVESEQLGSVQTRWLVDFPTKGRAGKGGGASAGAGPTTARPKLETFDLVTCVDSLSGLQPRTMNRTLRRMWDAADDMIVVAEHGRRRFDAIDAAREFVRRMAFEAERAGVPPEEIPCIVAPCPHLLQCPRRGDRHGCFFGLRVPRGDFAPTAQVHELKIPSRFGDNIMARYAYVVIRKRGDASLAAARATAGEGTPAVPGRILSKPQKKGKHAILELCSEDGYYTRAVVAKSKKEEYLASKTAFWGGTWPFSTPTKGILRQLSGSEIMAPKVTRKNPRGGAEDNASHDRPNTGHGVQREARGDGSYDQDGEWVPKKRTEPNMTFSPEMAAQEEEMRRQEAARTAAEVNDDGETEDQDFDLEMLRLLKEQGMLGKGADLDDIGMGLDDIDMGWDEDDETASASSKRAMADLHGSKTARRREMAKNKRKRLGRGATRSKVEQREERSPESMPDDESSVKELEDLRRSFGFGPIRRP